MDDRKAIRGWLWYDWANSAFITTIMAAVMPIYYVSVVGADLQGGRADAYWAFTQTAASVLIAVLMPLLGAIADHSGNKKAFLRFFCVLGAAASACLALAGRGDVWLASALVIVGMLGFNGGNTFYDALLGDIAPPERRARLSANGYALGYLGGGVLLALNLALILGWETFGLASEAQASRISFVTVGVWWLLFAVPLFRHVRERQPAAEAGPLGERVREGLRRLGQTARRVRRYPELWKFMAAYWFFNDGINTIIVMAASYGASIGLESSDLIAALLLTQFIGFPATMLFGRLAERLGSKRMLFASLILYLVIVMLGYFMQNAMHFYALAALVGLVQGGSQATARAIYSQLIPPPRAAEFFGFLGFTSRLVSFGGPFVFGVVKLWTGSSRAAILGIALFFLIGLVLLAFVNLEKGRREAALEPGGPEAAGA